MESNDHQKLTLPKVARSDTVCMTSAEVLQKLRETQSQTLFSKIRQAAL